MDEKCELSVIMGIYNAQSYTLLQRAMESILNQTYISFELIICDDGSCDDTYALLQKYTMFDHRIRLVRHSKNLGLAAALNTCISLAQGRFIARHDADDFSIPERFQNQIDFLDSHKKIDFVGSNILLCDESGKIWGRRVFPNYPQKRDFLFTLPFLHGSLMFRREALALAGGYRVAKETRRCEDYDLLMRMYSLGMYGANLDTAYYQFTEDTTCIKRRKYRYKIDEVNIRYKGFSALGLMPSAIPYVIKPLIVGLVPSHILCRLKKVRKF